MKQNQSILQQKILVQNSQIYDGYYKQGVIDGWDKQDKKYNFAHLLKIAKLAKLPMKNASVLDVGCGTGDFVPTLRSLHIKSYRGVDIYRPALKLAQEKFPQEQFQYADILSKKFSGKFDFVFCSGALSVRLKEIDNYDFLESMIRKIWKMTTYGLAFNLLTDEDKAPDDNLFYYHLPLVEVMCKNIAPGASVRTKKTPIKTPGYEDDAQAHCYIFRQNQTP